jgi:cyanophycinase
MRFFFTLLLIPVCLAAQGSVVLVGGGSEDPGTWSDQPYGWMVSAADSGKIINIDVDTATPWYASYFRWLGADDGSHHLQIATREAANDSATYLELISARGIFIEGGDQWDYVSTWKGTLVEDALHAVFASGGVIGGTSAGLAVLGEVVFDARYGSAYPDEVAYNPYHPRMQFTDDFLQILPGIITDSHFHNRGRLGRLVPMLARCITDFGDSTITGIGVDEQTALCVDPDGESAVYGKGSVTVIYPTAESQIQCLPNVPVQFSMLGYDQLIHGSRYNIYTHTLSDSGLFMHTVMPVAIQLPVQEVLLDGSTENTAQQGAFYAGNLLSDPSAGFDGSLQLLAGLGDLPTMIVSPKIWNLHPQFDDDFFANRWIAGFYALALHPGFTALWLDDNSTARVTSNGELRCDGPAYLLDSRSVNYSGVNPDGSNLPGLIGARLNFLKPGCLFDLNSGTISGVPETQQLPAGSTSASGHFTIAPAYPNPFNGATRLQIELSRPANISVEVYSITGMRVARLAARHFAAGQHQLTWAAGSHPSGVYFIRYSGAGIHRVQKLFLLR